MHLATQDAFNVACLYILDRLSGDPGALPGHAQTRVVTLNHSPGITILPIQFTT
jgi:hypothetical protein